jgi:hypothetical protein
VDAGQSIGGYTPLVLDSSGRPHLGYSLSGKLHYAHHDGTQWHIETVESEQGTWIDLALDSADHPHISYLDDWPNYDLKYAHFDGTSWVIETVDSTGNVGRYTSLDLDANDHPHISYHDRTHLNLNYAYFDGMSWFTQTVDSGGWDGTSLALDASGHPHITYDDSAGDNMDYLRYAHYDGTDWLIEVVESGTWLGDHSALVLDPVGQPHMSYNDNEHKMIKYARYLDGSWQIDEVARCLGDGNYCKGTSLALDSNGRQHIAFGDGSQNATGYAYFDGYNWQVETVGLGYGYPSLHLDTNGFPHIGFHRGGELKYAYIPECTSISQVFADGPVSVPAGRPALYSATVIPTDTTAPKFSWDNGTSGSPTPYLWGFPGSYSLTVTATNLCTDQVTNSYSVTVFPQPIESVEIRGPRSLAIGFAGLYTAIYSPPTASLPITHTWDNGSLEATATYSWPASGTYRITTTALNPYSQVSDTYSVTVFCQPPEQIDVAGPWRLLLHQVGTYQAVALPATTTTPITYTWDNGTIGSSTTYRWTMPGQHRIAITAVNDCGTVHQDFTVTVRPVGWFIEVVDPEGAWAGKNVSLALDASGFPHISYYSDPEKDLRYAKMDRNGWQTETVDGTGQVGRYPSLALDSADHPLISYYDVTHGDLKYARFDGTDWLSETVDGVDDVGWWTSLALDGNDHPHIIYYDNTNDNLKYAHYNGVSWQSEIVHSLDNCDTRTSLAVDAAGHPHVAFSHKYGEDCGLVYGQYDGTSWSFGLVDGSSYADNSGVGAYASLTLDNSGHPHISYHAWYWYFAPWPFPSYTDYCVKHAWSDDGYNWHNETVQCRRDRNVGTYTSLALDSSGRPRISYRSEWNDKLKYAWFEGLIWTVDGLLDAGKGSSLALDKVDWPHIAYYASAALKHAYLCNLLTGVEIQGPSSLLVGQTGTFRAAPVPITASRPLEYTWDNGTVGASTTYSWTVTGTHSLTISAWNPCGEAQATHAVRVLTEWPYHFYLPFVTRQDRGNGP